MAIQGNGSSGYMTRATPGVNTGSMTVAMWIRTPASLPDWLNVFYIEQGSRIFALETNYTHFEASTYTGDWRGPSGSATLSTNTWYHVAVTYSGTEIKLYTNGAQDGSTDSGAYTTGAADMIDFGAWDRGGEYWGGRWAAVKLWNAALSADEIAAEVYTVRPQRTANLAAWWPMVDTASAGYLADYSGAAMTLSTSGTFTAADGPPVGWGAPVLVYGAAVSGTTITNSGSTAATTSASAAGVVGITGDGSAAASSTAAASGEVGIAGSGSVAGSSAASAAGVVAITGSGIVECSGVATASGEVAITGSGGVVISSTALASGEVAITGAGSTGVVSTAAASGVVAITGSGSVTATSTAAAQVGEYAAVGWLAAMHSAARLDVTCRSARLEIKHAAAVLVERVEP